MAMGSNPIIANHLNVVSTDWHHGKSRVIGRVPKIEKIFFISAGAINKCLY
jgi:hypothetical protein